MNRYVAVSEEFANDPSAKVKSRGLLFDRRVTRVITPGTLIDEKFMDPWENNFLFSIYADPEVIGRKNPESPGKQSNPGARTSPEPVEIGVAWLNLSSGDFFTQKTELSTLSSVIARI